MKRFMGTVVALTGMLAWAPEARAEWPAGVTVVKSEKGGSVSAKGKLEDGKPMDDLAWASTSSMACFPATQNEKFRGNHVMLATEIPPKSIMTVTVIPDDPTMDLSIWGYTVAPNNFRTPPGIPSCVACEAEHKWDRPKKGKTQDHTRTITFNAIGNPYNVLVGVSGPKTAVKGGFTLKVDVK